MIRLDVTLPWLHKFIEEDLCFSLVWPNWPDLTGTGQVPADPVPKANPSYDRTLRPSLTPLAGLA